MEKKRRGRGRPRLPEGREREVNVTIRVRREERTLLRRAARKENKTFSTWARDILLKAC